MTDTEQTGAAEVLIHLASRAAAHIRSKHHVNSAHQMIADTMIKRLECAGNHSAKLRRPSRRIVRGLRHAPTVFAQCCADNLSTLTGAALAAFGHVNWAEYYAEDDWSRPFLPDFANGEGIGPDGVLIHDEIILGLFVLGPDTVYPPHAHPAAEAYIVISGEAEFQVGADARHSSKKPGDLILHRENEPHAIRTHDKPLFAIYVWSGAISERSWYSDDMANPTAKVRYPTIKKGIAKLFPTD